MKRTARANVPGIRQRTQYTCMSASIAAALMALGKEITEDDVNRVLKAQAMKGARWEEALGTIQYFGGRGTLVVPATVNMLKEWTDQEIPVLIGWNPEGRPWSHASVVAEVDSAGNVHIMDPNIPDPDEHFRIVPKDEFYKRWLEPCGDSLIIRRPAMAVTLEVDERGRQFI